MTSASRTGMPRIYGASIFATIMMQPMRLGFRLLQRVSPEMSAALAERLFFTAPRTRLGDDLRAVLARGERFTLRLDGRPVVGWSWGPAGAGTPVIYLMHGWGSRGGRLAGFVEPLLEAGYRVVTHDAPGHGSSYGRLSSLPQFAAAMLAVAERFGPAAGVIAHSM